VSASAESDARVHHREQDIRYQRADNCKYSKDYVKSYNPEISLRQYQINALDKVASQFDNDSKRQFLLEMATGTGKTLLCAALIMRFLKSNNAQRVLF